MMGLQIDIYPRWLTLRQASAYCGINDRRLIELIRDGKIKGGQHQDKGNKDWFVDRLSIDKYMEAMTLGNRFQEKILEVRRRLG